MSHPILLPLYSTVYHLLLLQLLLLYYYLLLYLPTTYIQQLHTQQLNPKLNRTYPKKTICYIRFYLHSYNIYSVNNECARYFIKVPVACPPISSVFYVCVCVFMCDCFLCVRMHMCVKVCVFFLEITIGHWLQTSWIPKGNLCSRWRCFKRQIIFIDLGSNY